MHAGSAFACVTILQFSEYSCMLMVALILIMIRTPVTEIDCATEGIARVHYNRVVQEI